MTPRYLVDKAGPQAIIRHLEACDASFHPRLTSRVDLAQYTRKLTTNTTRFEAWSDDQLIGLVATYCNAADRGTAFVSNVSVDPNFVRRGIARTLMQTCIVFVRNLNFKRLSLEVEPTATPAIQLYLALGFIAQTHHFTTQHFMVLEFDQSLRSEGQS